MFHFVIIKLFLYAHAISAEPCAKFEQTHHIPYQYEDPYDIQSLFKHKKKKEIIDQNFNQAMLYLRECDNAKINWTSALPISTPSPSVRKAGADAFLKSNLQNYSESRGNKKLIHRIIEKFTSDGIKVKKENIIINNSIFNIIQDIYSIIDWKPGDTILLPTPAFGHYVVQASNNNIEVQLIPTTQESSWKITPAQLDQALSQGKAKIFIFNNPVNPTGIVYTKEEVQALAKVLMKYTVLVIADEIFNEVVINEHKKPYSIGAVKGMENRTITLNGVGKSRGLTGLRISYGCGPKEIISRLTLHLSGFSRPSEEAAIEALTLNQENASYIKENRRKYIKNILFIESQINILNQKLSKHFNKKCEKTIYTKLFLGIPDATNVILISFQGLKGKIFKNKALASSLELAYFLYQEAGVAVVPGEAFFMEGNQMVLRFPVSPDQNELKRGFSKILSALLMLGNPPTL